MYGIEHLKEAGLIACNLAKGYAKRAEDGKITTWEWITFAPKLLDIKDVIANAAEIWREMLDLTDDEQIELTNYLAEKLNKTPQKASRIVKKAFNFLMALGSLADEFDGD